MTNRNSPVTEDELHVYADGEIPADLVVLGRDPMRVDPRSLIEIPIERTMAGGRWVYES